MFKVKEVGEPDYIIQVYEDKQIFGKLVNYHFHPNAVEGVVNYTSPQCDNGAADGFHPTVSPLAPLNKDIPVYHHNVCKTSKQWICNYTFFTVR